MKNTKENSRFTELSFSPINKYINNFVLCNYLILIYLFIFKNESYNLFFQVIFSSMK